MTIPDHPANEIEAVAIAICIASGYRIPDEDWRSFRNGEMQPITLTVELGDEYHRWRTYTPQAKAAITALDHIRAQQQPSDAVKAAILTEREACAKIADDDEGYFTWAGTDEGVAVRQHVASEIAAAIRARGEK